MIVVVIQQNTMGCAFGVVILAAVQCPQQHDQSADPEPQSGPDNQCDCTHDVFPATRRNAFTVTIRDDPAMVTDAISGETTPKIASGIAVKL